MRKVAPDKAGNAVNQNIWFLVKLKPALFRLTTTTDQSIQTLKASISAGMEISRFLFAILLPSERQKSGCSGSQRLST